MITLVIEIFTVLPLFTASGLFAVMEIDGESVKRCYPRSI